MSTIPPLLGLRSATQHICCAGHHQVYAVEGLSQDGGPTDDRAIQGYGGSAAPPGRDCGAIAGRMGGAARDGALRLPPFSCGCPIVSAHIWNMCDIFSIKPYTNIRVTSRKVATFLFRLMLDSRVVDVRMVYTHRIPCPNP